MPIGKEDLQSVIAVGNLFLLVVRTPAAEKFLRRIRRQEIACTSFALP